MHELILVRQPIVASQRQMARLVEKISHFMEDEIIIRTAAPPPAGSHHDRMQCSIVVGMPETVDQITNERTKDVSHMKALILGEADNILEGRRKSSMREQYIRVKDRLLPSTIVMDIPDPVPDRAGGFCHSSGADGVIC